MKLDITTEHYLELVKKSYSLDLIYLLNLISEEYDVKPLIEESVKVKAIYTSLIRKGIITEEEKLTTLGTDLLNFVSKKTNKKFVKKKAEKSDFDEWWDCFPLTDEFKMGNKLFSGTRGLRTSKEKCRLAFNSIINEGVYTKEDIINATLYDVKMRKSNSLKQNKNNLMFLQNSYTYLFNKSFEPFISSTGKIMQDITTPIGSTDI